MSQATLCKDGIEMALVEEQGLWIVLRTSSGNELGRFEIDPTELRGVTAGRMSFQATDGDGNSVGIEAGTTGIRVRLEGRGHAPLNCRLSRGDVENAAASLSLRV